MTTENPISENEENNKVNTNDLSENTDNQSDIVADSPSEIPDEVESNTEEENAEKDVDKEVIIETDNNSVNDVDQSISEENIAESNISIETSAEDSTEEIAPQKSAETLLEELTLLINGKNAGAELHKFNTIKNALLQKINEDKTNTEQTAETIHPLQQKLNNLQNVFRQKHDEFVKNQEVELDKNLQHRKSIIENLKNLYTNAQPGTNLFKAIRDIKEQWKNAGQIAKNDFKLLNNDYFYHLNQFYQLLDLNKEYLEQEYAHNLETRKHIIDRAKQLEEEPVVQKALNELQYLHKLWKEEAEPVAEEFRETTWEEFREISNKIHERKSELSAQLEEEQTANLEKKNNIIASIKSLTGQDQNGHQYWQDAIKKAENWRTEFLKTGSVPKKNSNQMWNDFKNAMREFNAKKNDFYKNLKGSQQSNLDAKLKLVQTAQDNMLSEDWETAVPLFKKLQEEWKNIGHVPRSMTKKVWDDFRGACNTFFESYREKNNVAVDNWKDNYKQKRIILDELKSITSDQDGPQRIEALKTAWNNIGKVPRDKIAINTEFNKTLREKLKLNNMNEFDLREEGLSENQLTDKARKIKNQIADLEAEVVKLENNLGFFQNSSRENILLKDTYDKIDNFRSQIESLKSTLHNIISDNNAEH